MQYEFPSAAQRKHSRFAPWQSRVQISAFLSFVNDQTKRIPLRNQETDLVSSSSRFCDSPNFGPGLGPLKRELKSIPALGTQTG